MKIEISAVLPMYNEAALAERGIREVGEQLASITPAYEIICVDDGSSDGTAELIDRVANINAHVVALHFSRNFGKESSLAAGLDAARGQAVLFLDADLQHPPSLIPEMVRLWREGYHIVEGRKAQRGREGFLHRSFSKIFYGIITRSSGMVMQGSSDFKLLDRQAVDALKALPERSRFFRGLTSWIGFRRVAVDFDVIERVGGESRWSTRQLIRYAVNNILAFSTFPLYLTAWVGLFTTFLGVGLGVHTLYNYISGNAVSGFTTVILLLIFFSGITLLGVGTVAVYLAKVLEEVKSRPTYIIRRPVPGSQPYPDSPSQTGSTPEEFKAGS